MPTMLKAYMIRKEGDQWCVYPADGQGKSLGCHPTEEEAMAQLRAIEMAKNHADIRGVEIFATGTHNGDTYTPEDLDAMVAAYPDVGFVPPLKKGHPDGQRAWGWIENLRRAGEKLIADFVNLPEAVYEEIKQKGWGPTSSEIYWDFERDGKVWPRVLKAVALLGGDIPAVPGMKPVYDSLTSKGISKAYTVELKELTPEKGGATMAAIVEEIMVLKPEVKVDPVVVVVPVVDPLDDGVFKQLQADLGIKAEDEAKFKQRLMGSGWVPLSTHKETQAALAAKSAEDQARVESDRKARVAAFTASVISPNYQRHLGPMFDALTGGPKVAKFSKDGKVENVADVDVIAILEDFRDLLNRQTKRMFGELATVDTTRQEAPKENPREEADRRVKEYAVAHGKKLPDDYRECLHAVLNADPQLKNEYSAA